MFFGNRNSGIGSLKRSEIGKSKSEFRGTSAAVSAALTCSKCFLKSGTLRTVQTRQYGQHANVLHERQQFFKSKIERLKSFLHAGLLSEI